ncbi:AMP dependent coa ligase, partial [Operophtera brumata]
MIQDKVVTNGVSLEVPAHMSVGQTFLDKVREYAELNIAVGLKDLGVKTGDVVAVCGDSRSEYIAAAMGAVCCGATATFFNALFTQETESIQHIVQVDGDPTASGVLALSSVETESDARCYEAEEVRDGKDTALIFYSSGTTGLPKGAMISHINILGGYSVKQCNNFLTIMPWYHVYGLISSLIILINHKRLINCLMLVPPVVVFIAKSPLLEKYDTMPNFKKLVEGYGMTETTFVVLKYIDEIEAKRGLRAIPGVKLKIVDCETREKLGPNEKGEVCVKGPVIMKGYIGNDAATRDAFDEEGYLKTGDIGYYNDEEHFFIIDRLKEIIKYKGHQVAPAAVESIVLQHSAVADCGVVGKPDEVAGELPTAFV